MATAVDSKVPLLTECNEPVIWCTPCSRDGKESPGNTFCLDCQEYFCELCTRSHQTFTLLKDHRLEQCNTEVNEPLNLAVRKPSEFDHPLMETEAKGIVQLDAKLVDFERKLKEKLKQPSGNKGKNKQQVTGQSASHSEEGYSITQCPLHDGENLTVYCKDHRNVGCHVCAAISHRQCRTVIFLPEASKDFSESKAKTDYIDDITNTLKNLQNTKTARTRDMEALSQKSSKIISNIQRYKDQMIEKLEKIAAESVKAVVCQTEVLTEKIQYDMDKCDTMLAEIKDLQNAFSVIDEGNDLLIFIQATRGRDTLDKGNKFSKVASAAIGKEDLQYRIGTSLETFLNSMHVFGRMTIKSNNPSLDTLTFFHYKFNAFNSKIEHEMANRTLAIRDYCDVPPKYIAFVIAKRNVDMLFVQDEFEKIKEILVLGGRAFGICSTGPSQLAVTVNQNQVGQVQLLIIRNGISHYFFSPVKKTLNFSHPVYGIAYHQENLFIGEQRQVNVYDMNGTALYKIYVNGMPKHITVSPDGNLVYIADFMAGVVIMTRAGEVKQILTDKYLNGVHGISLDERGNVYATGYISSSIVKFDKQGTRQGVYIARSDIFNNPFQIYKKRNGKLVLASGSNELLRNIP